VIDLGARFKGARTFVEDVSGVIPSFYQDAGQELSNWIAKAPTIKTEKILGSNSPKEQAAPTIFSNIFSKTK
jgi:hypothetical protein